MNPNTIFIIGFAVGYWLAAAVVYLLTKKQKE